MRDLINLVSYLTEAQTLSTSSLTKEVDVLRMPVIGKVEKMQRLADAGSGKAKAATYADTDLVGFANEYKDTTTHDEIEIIRYPRFEALISKILKGEPLWLADGSTVTVDPDEADRLEGLIQTGEFSGSIQLQLADGSEILLSKLAKTSDFGGQALGGKGKNQEIGKEEALLKPSQINITDADIPASRLGEAIINNEVLLSTDYGKSVIEMAKTIMQGENPEVPKEYSNKIKKAIVDYAGEYLGVLALIHGTSSFLKKQEFETWLGGSVSDLVINFPSATNNSIADSYMFAQISNKNTNHTINLSSKGTGGGAAPALGGLKIPEEIKNDPKLKGAVEFIEFSQKDAPGPAPKSISTIFLGMNVLHENVPESIPKKFNKFLPWDVEKITQQVNESIKNFKTLGGEETVPKKYQTLWQDIDFTKASSDGGKLSYVTKKAVMEAVNEKNALPEFRETVLLVLDMNFVQQYADLKSNRLVFETFWPAKLDGKVTLETKAGATDPTKGGFSFKISPENPKTEIEMPDEGGTDVEPQDQEDFEKAAEKIAKGTKSKSATTRKKVGDVGRAKR